jgi:hypothetical protein
MNAVYPRSARFREALGQGTLKGGNLDNRQFNDYLTEVRSRNCSSAPTSSGRRVLRMAPIVGATGALNRVYLNIGTFSEEWLTHFNPLVGGQPITPIKITVARENSAYFKATEAQTFNTARFFLKTTGAHHLADAPDGQHYLTTDQQVLTRGKVAFAENCARCHSSKLPAALPALDPDGCAGSGYLACWDKYWASTQTPAFKQQMRDIVMAPDFLQDNYLSSEFRVPVTLLQTNACSPLATNAIGGNIWDNFSSQSYKDLPSVGEITYYHPYTGEPRTCKMPAGGRLHQAAVARQPMWSTAPFLLNNTMGHFEESPSVEARLRSFDDSIHKMLWPQDRDKDSLLGAPFRCHRPRGRSGPGGHGRSRYLKVGAGFLPDFLQKTLSAQRTLFPGLFSEEGVRLVADPAGHADRAAREPEPAVGRSDPLKRAQHSAKVGEVVVKILARLHALGGNATNDQAGRCSPTSSSRCSRSASVPTSSSIAVTSSAPTCRTTTRRR